MKRYLLILCLVFIVITTSLFLFSQNSRKEDEVQWSSSYSSVLNLPQGDISLLVADTEESRIRGLSGISSMKEDTALLFVFDRPGYYGIWMKDMLFSIDIIWLNENFEVIHIEKNVSPDTYPKTFSAQKMSSFVIEANTGFCEKNDIFVGKKLLLSKKTIQS